MPGDANIRFDLAEFFEQDAYPRFEYFSPGAGIHHHAMLCTKIVACPDDVRVHTQKIACGIQVDLHYAVEQGRKVGWPEKQIGEHFFQAYQIPRGLENCGFQIRDYGMRLSELIDGALRFEKAARCVGVGKVVIINIFNIRCVVKRMGTEFPVHARIPEAHAPFVHYAAVRMQVGWPVMRSAGRYSHAIVAEMGEKRHVRDPG